MKNIKLNLLQLFLLGLLFSFSSCGGGGSSSSDDPEEKTELGEEVTSDIYKLERSPVELIGGKVKININCEFPSEYTEEGQVVTITPYLENEAGDREDFEEISYMEGEDFTVDEGGLSEYESEIDYNPEMNKSNLYLDVVIKNMDSETEEEEVISENKLKLGEGIITTSNLLEQDYKPMFPNNSSIVGKGGIKSSMFNFKKNSYSVNKNDLKSTDFNMIREISKKINKDYKIITVDIIGYASPEGTVNFNEILSMNRAKSVKKEMEKVLKSNKISIENDTYMLRGEGPDWNGFFEMIEMNNITDKELILNTLRDEPVLDSRADLLKGFVEIYPEIETEILSKLRRVELKIAYDSNKDSSGPKEIIVKAENLDNISYDDLLEAMSNVEENEMLAISEKLIDKNPEDYRSYSSHGVALWLNDRKEEALNNFVKAFEVDQNEITRGNLAVVKMDNGEYYEAEQLMSEVSIKQMRYNKGILLFLKGEYQQSVDYMGDLNLVNKSLALLLSGNTAESLEVINNIEEDTPKNEYIRAICYARDDMMEESKTSIDKFSLDSEEYKERALSDMEFRYIDMEEEGDEEEEFEEGDEEEEFEEGEEEEEFEEGEEEEFEEGEEEEFEEGEEEEFEEGEEEEFEEEA